MNEHIQVPKELLESLLNSVNGDFYMGKEWEESTVAQLRKHVAALAYANDNEQSQAQQPCKGKFFNEYEDGSIHTFCTSDEAFKHSICSSVEPSKVAYQISDLQSQAQQPSEEFKSAALQELYNFQEATGCDVAAELKPHQLAQAQQESKWISVEEAKAILKDGDLIFAYCEYYGVVEAAYAFEEGYYNPHRIVKKNGDSYRINTFTHFMFRKPTSLPPAPEGE